MTFLRHWALLGLTMIGAVACGSGAGTPGHEAPNPDGGPGTNPAPVVDPDAGGPNPTATCTGDTTEQLDKGATQLAKLCGRGHGDPITLAFCGATPPTITSLADVLKAIGLAFGPGPYTNGLTSGQHGNPSFMLSAQSTSIAKRSVSQLNPRAIFFTPPLARGRMTGTPKPNPSFVAMGFTRGDQAIELLAKDPTMTGPEGDIRFFLLKYEQACNAAQGGCTPGDLYTPAVESNFASWSLYDDEDLKNTVLDCKQCHQPAGLGTPRMLRMQELQRPWQHWMYNDALGVDALRADFHAAHGTAEAYGGIPGAAIDFGDVQQLEAFVENNGFLAQPNEFLGVKIASELTATGSSATWQSLYQGSETGQFIPVPYFDFMATDATLVQPLISQYSAVMAGKLPASQLGDLGNVFNDTAQRAMSHKPALGLSGRQILVQICQGCHNSHLDQTISRSFFNVERLDSLSRAEKDEAIRRINLPQDGCGQMPPSRFSELDAAEIGLVQAELQK